MKKHIDGICHNCGKKTEMNEQTGILYYYCPEHNQLRKIYARKYKKSVKGFWKKVKK